MSSPQTVLCALDFSAGSARALIAAADLAERSRATLHLLHVDPLFRARLAFSPEGDFDATFRRRIERYVNATLNADDAFEVLAPIVHEARGEAPADGILRYAGQIGASWIVTSTHSRQGLDHLLLGSVAAEVLRRSSVPVLVVPEGSEAVSPTPDHPVVAAVDLSEFGAQTLGAADALARAYSAPLAVAHIRDVPPSSLVGDHVRTERWTSGSAPVSREEAHAAIRQLVEPLDLDVAPEVYVLPGDPKAALVELASTSRAGALVLGTHGRTGWSRVRLGSVAEWVVRHAACPVLTVPMVSEHAAA